MTERSSKATIIVGDANESLFGLEHNSIQTCVTSPPYWGLRDYESETQLGQEDTPEEYIENLVNIFRKVKDLLADDGTLWVNIGDTYVGTGHKGTWRDPKNPHGRNGQTKALNNKVAGLKRKDMIGIPWRLAFALQADGWYLRSDIIWHKPNQMPMPLKDRPISSYEHIFLLSKSPVYYYDYESVQEERVDGKGKRRQRDVWSVNTKPYPEAHFAVYPEELVNPCVLAGSRVGDTILDPFSGSGTTGVSSLKLGRNYVGLEANRDFAELSVKRITSETPESSVVSLLTVDDL